jgi:hypothetical protein
MTNQVITPDGNITGQSIIFKNNLSDYGSIKKLIILIIVFAAIQFQLAARLYSGRGRQISLFIT